jgi:antibiotic biosynthesis monooxygenase (ABM) superfamily enzyme
VVRPKSIIWFERTYLAALLLGAAATAMTWTSDMGSQHVVQVERMLGQRFFPVVVVFGYSILGLLWFFTARGRSNSARWTMTVIIGLSVISYIFSLFGAGHFGSAASFVSLASVLLAVAAVVFLFRPDARTWFTQPI